MTPTLASIVEHRIELYKAITALYLGTPASVVDAVRAKADVVSTDTAWLIGEVERLDGLFNEKVDELAGSQAFIAEYRAIKQKLAQAVQAFEISPFNTSI